MKKAIISFFATIAKLLVLSLLSKVVYDWNNLANVFGPSISYTQWVGIIVIINGIVPRDIKSRIKDDKQRS